MKRISPRKKSVEARIDDILVGRTRSPRTIESALEEIRRADRVDLLDRLLLADAETDRRVLAAALGSARPGALRRNAVRREVFVRFAAGSSSRETLARVFAQISERAPGDATCHAILARRLTALDRAGPELPASPLPRWRSRIEIVAEEHAASAVGSLLAAAVEVDLLADHLRARQNDPHDRLLGYRIRRAQETIAAAIDRMGIEFFGRPGETVPYDPRRHEYVGLLAQVASGMPVRLVTRGFQRAGTPPPAVVQKAQVE